MYLSTCNEYCNNGGKFKNYNKLAVDLRGKNRDPYTGLVVCI